MALKKKESKFRLNTGHEGPNLEQKYSSTLSLTSALDADVWLTSHAGHFTPGRYFVRTVQAAG